MQKLSKERLFELQELLDQKIRNLFLSILKLSYDDNVCCNNARYRESNLRVDAEEPCRENNFSVSYFVRQIVHLNGFQKKIVMKLQIKVQKKNYFFRDRGIAAEVWVFLQLIRKVLRFFNGKIADENRKNCRNYDKHIPYKKVDSVPKNSNRYDFNLCKEVDGKYF